MTKTIISKKNGFVSQSFIEKQRENKVKIIIKISEKSHFWHQNEWKKRLFPILLIDFFKLYGKEKQSQFDALFLYKLEVIFECLIKFCVNLDGFEGFILKSYFLLHNEFFDF